jgi:hypothetical protein
MQYLVENITENTYLESFNSFDQSPNWVSRKEDAKRFPSREVALTARKNAIEGSIRLEVSSSSPSLSPSASSSPSSSEAPPSEVPPSPSASTSKVPGASPRPLVIKISADYTPKLPTFKSVENKITKDGHEGWCLYCGKWTHDSCEPDARNYKCPKCENTTCFGAEELLVQGLFK